MQIGGLLYVFLENRVYPLAIIGDGDWILSN